MRAKQQQKAHVIHTIHHWLRPSLLAHFLLHLRSWFTLAVCCIFVLVYLLVYFLEHGGRWAPLFIALVFAVYAYGIWGYMMYRVLFDFKYPAPISVLVPFIDDVLLYFVTVTQNMFIYAAMVELSPTIYNGIDGNTMDRWHRLYLCFFLATETMSSFGTGSIHPNPNASDVTGFIPVWLNSIQGDIFLLFIFTWYTIRRVYRYEKEVYGVEIGLKIV